MKQNFGRTLIGVVLLLALLGHSAHFYRIGLVERLDAIFYDAKIRLTMPQAIDSRIVIVDIDEKSLAEEGRWPWSRDRLALLMDKLFDQYAVQLVGFDVVFAEPDTSSGIKALESMARGSLRDNPSFLSSLRGMRDQLDYDARFAQSLKNRKVILGYYVSNVAGGQSSGVLPPPAIPREAFAAPPFAISQWHSFGANLPVLQQAAAGAGHFNPLVDFDGISRRIPMLVEYQGSYYESLALAMVRALFDFPAISPGYADPGSDAYLEWLELQHARGTTRIPVDENVAALIPFRGTQGSFPYVSASDVLRGRVPTETLHGRIVLVGTSAPGLMDLRATPVAAAYPGVEVHANLIAGILDDALKHKPDYLLGADVVQVLLVGLLMILLLPRLSPLKATLMAMTILSVLVAINLHLWQSSNLVMPFANAFLLAIMLYMLNMSWGYFVESRTKRQLTRLFGQYVPPELVEEMSRDPENYSMAGRKAELTVLFSDVRGFTSISEGLQPDELATLMNHYLGAMTAVIRHHRGTLDKYIGDAIMAFWGAPVSEAEHARHAVLAALGMMERLPEMNKELAARGWPELKIGIGVNSGVMTVGDMGSPVRQSYTVMGDAVNLGSRLEGITKQYGVAIIIGESTRERLGDAFVLRELDRVRVKGKAEPVAIYEPLGLAGTLGGETLEKLHDWNQALCAYQAQDWDRAELLLQRLVSKHPHYLYDLYIRRIAHYRAESPGSDWDGVTTFETK